MTSTLPTTIARGTLVGLLAGLLIGAYVSILSADYVVQRADYTTSLRYEEAQSRYASVVVSAFGVVFAVVGPVVAAASFGSWIRHAVYGLVGGIGLVLVVSLTCAAGLNQRPFNPHKTAYSTSIDLARLYFVPIAVIVGPICGILIGNIRNSVQNNATNCNSQYA